MKTLLSLILTIIVLGLFSQRKVTQTYMLNKKSADSLYKIKDFFNASCSYSKCYYELLNKSLQEDVYNLVCTFALINKTDSAFKFLTALKTSYNFLDYKSLEIDADFNSIKNNLN